jgi:BirA family biotin operon repressor/biotin-[acetyl-CoA-carboxylase] ligase
VSVLPDFANRVLDRCGSTNDLARELGEAGAPHGAWVSARAQDQGRGRLGREWQSLEGNLFLSMVARIEDKSRWTWVPLATAVAATRVLRARFPTLDLRIKWPNDLWIMREGQGHKAGGILCEAVGTRSGSFIIIGIGLNCAYAPQGIDQAALSLSEALDVKLSADDVRADVIDGIRRAMDELTIQGSEGIRADYERWAVFGPGSEIAWSHPTTGGVGGEGSVRGLGPHGELLVVENGAEKRLFAEDIRVRLKA